MYFERHVDERIGYQKLPEDFHKFVELFVSFERQIKDISSTFCSMYNAKKGRNKDASHLQNEIEGMKKKLKDIEKNVGSLGQLFKQNLDFLVDAVELKEKLSTEKQIMVEESTQLKLDLRNKQEEIMQMSKQLEYHANISLKLTDKLHQLSRYAKLLERKCEDNVIENELNSLKYINSKGSLKELNNKAKSLSEKLTKENESLKETNTELEKRVAELKELLKEHDIHKQDKQPNEEILDERILDFFHEGDSLRTENNRKQLTIEKLKEEVESLKKDSQLQVDILTRENVMLQKLINDQNLKIQQVTEDGHKKVQFKEKAIHNGLLELHLKLSHSKKENIKLKEDLHMKELEGQKKILELEEALRVKERNMQLYEGYLKQAREIIGQLRKISITNIPI